MLTAIRSVRLWPSSFARAYNPRLMFAMTEGEKRQFQGAVPPEEDPGNSPRRDSDEFFHVSVTLQPVIESAPITKFENFPMCSD